MSLMPQWKRISTARYIPINPPPVTKYLPLKLIKTKTNEKGVHQEKEHVRMNECQRNERFAGGDIGVRVRLMVRGGCLPVRWNLRMAWKYDDDKRRCGLVETESMC